MCIERKDHKPRPSDSGPDSGAKTGNGARNKNRERNEGIISKENNL